MTLWPLRASPTTLLQVNRPSSLKMPPRKKIKLNFTPAEPQSSKEPDDRTARRTAHLAARRSAREDFDPPFDIEDEDQNDEDEDEGNIDEENPDPDESSEPESDEGRQLKALTQSNTSLQNGFNTAEGQRVVHEHPPRNIRKSLHLWNARRAPQGSSSTDRDAPSESVGTEE